MRILIVDDNPMNVTVVQEMLKRAGYWDVHAAASAMDMFRLLGLSEEGEAAEGAALQEPDYDLILLDMMMPRVDGIAACRAIQQVERLRDIPIIMVTAIGDSKKLAEALDAGASDYVTKPINKIELLARIRAALRLKEEKDWHKERDRRLREELQLAKGVQSAVLPTPIAERGIEIGAVYIPSEELAGDLYAWHRIGEDRYGVAVIDAMGHGISSSLVCMFIASVLKDTMTQLAEPKRVVEELNRRAMQLDFGDQLIQYYYTGIYLVVDLAEGRLEYVNAGHPPGLILRRDGRMELLEGGCPAIGLFDSITIAQHAVQVEPGDRIVLVTDGLIDALEPEDDADRMERLFDKLRELSSRSAPRDWEAELPTALPANGRSDDRCLVWIDLLQRD